MLMMTGIAGYYGFWVNYIAAVDLILVVIAKALREERLLCAELATIPPMPDKANCLFLNCCEKKAR